MEDETVTAGADELLTWLFSTETDDEDYAIELSKLLEASTEKTYPMKVKIINDPYWHPLIFQTAASYITINGNEELCGSSFSDSDTSYMAGIGIGSGSGSGVVVGDGGAWDGGWIETKEEENENWLVNGGLTVCDDDMVAEFVGDEFEHAR